MTAVELTELLRGKSSLLFAVDQAPFVISTEGGREHTFCVLVPLMTTDGRRFADPDADFPNRGRVWWMLRSDIDTQVVRPGSIWSGELKEARKGYNPYNPRKDRYQVDQETLSFGAKDWIEIVDVDGETADPTAALSESGIPFERPTLGRVILRAERDMVGPFRASWDPTRSRLHLSATNLGKPQAYRIPVETLAEDEHVESFRFTTNQWAPEEPEEEMPLFLVHDRHLDLIKQSGEVVDAATDAQVVKWVLGLAGYSNQERSPFHEALERLPDEGVVERSEFPGRVERFRRICADADRVRGLGLEVAEVLGGQPAFRDLVEQHLQELAAERVEELVSLERAKIAGRIEDLAAQQDKLERELGVIEEQFDQRKAHQERELAVEHDRWVKGLTRREEEVGAREAALEQREREIGERLQRLIERYTAHGDEVGDQILAQLPILERAGVLGGTRGRDGGRSERPSALTLPAWLDQPVPHGTLSESAFLRQFQDVAARRGFVFHDDDLANFHIASKVGTWTLVTGPSGVGKSSLPRLYAEALGALDEFLNIPVRPDWLDDRDVLGAFNALSSRYEPATTGLVERLVTAHEDVQRGRGGLYLVCLDEMNLARVEHYFSQFLSVLEEPAERRALQLFGLGVEQPGEPFARYRLLPLTDNVRFIGTVNVDETTHFLSPKVLDRAAVLTLEPPDLDRRTGPRRKAKELAITPVHVDEYRSWIHGPEEAPDSVRRLVLELDGRLRPIRSGLGYRQRDRILSYVASAGGLLDEDRAVDLALAQAVVPRIHREHPAFPSAIGELVALLPADVYPRTGRFLAALQAEQGRDFFQML